jgi:hypothetical protein
MKGFFALPKTTSKGSTPRQSQDKATNLKYVEHVEYWGHKKGYCFTAADAKDWESMMLRPSILTMADNFLGPRDCSCIKYMSPRKLVARRAGLRQRRINHLHFDTETKTTVNVATDPIDLQFLPLNLDRLYRREGLNINKSTLIWSDTYADMTLAAVWDLFLTRLFGVARLATCPSDIILVNFETIAGRRISLEDRKDMTSPQVATDAIQKAYLAYLTGLDEMTSPGFKTAEQARQVTFTFLSMPTYLAEYDWEGELTEEEVRPWLEERIQDSGEDGEEAE